MISFSHTEARGNVGRDVGVPLLIPIHEYHYIAYVARTQTIKKQWRRLISLPLVFFDIVKVVPTNNDGPVHFSTMTCSSNDATSNWHSASEWALLINVGSCNTARLNTRIACAMYGRTGQTIMTKHTDKPNDIIIQTNFATKRVLRCHEETNRTRSAWLTWQSKQNWAITNDKCRSKTKVIFLVNIVILKNNKLYIHMKSRR